MDCSASLTRAAVAFASKVSTSCPPLFVVTVPMVIPDRTRLPDSINGPKFPVAEYTSSECAPPLRSSVRVAPLKLSAVDSSASKIVTLPSRTTGGPPSVNDGLPSSVLIRSNCVSSVPLLVNRIAVKSRSVSHESPTITILPSVCSAMSRYLGIFAW